MQPSMSHVSAVRVLDSLEGLLGESAARVPVVAAVTSDSGSIPVAHVAPYDHALETLIADATVTEPETFEGYLQRFTNIRDSISLNDVSGSMQERAEAIIDKLLEFCEIPSFDGYSAEEKLLWESYTKGNKRRLARYKTAFLTTSLPDQLRPHFEIGSLPKLSRRDRIDTDHGTEIHRLQGNYLLAELDMCVVVCRNLDQGRL